MNGAYNVLLVHNRYQQRGGEDQVVEAEAALLEQHGHAVAMYERDNHELENYGNLRAAAHTLWSLSTWRTLRKEIEKLRPDVIHVHNTFPLISPSIYWVAARYRLPVVQTLHNFRFACVQAMFLRNGAVCEKCLGRFPWQGIVRACYRGSRAQSGVIAGMLGLHRSLGTYRNKVSRYIALSRFCKDKFIQAGLPAERLCVKPNFVDLPPVEDGPRRGALFVGRLAPEKGTGVLLKALASMSTFRITVIGSGPELSRFQAHPQVQLLGWRDQHGVHEAMAAASYLVMPSIWYENFPRTLVEAYACGLPVIASRIGSLAELVEHNYTGLLFDPASPQEPERTLRWAEDNPERMRILGKNARALYEARYTPAKNYDQLMAVYDQALAEAQQQQEVRT